MLIFSFAKTSRMLWRPPAGRALHSHDGGPADGKTAFFEDYCGQLHVIDDQPDDAEIGGIGNGRVRILIWASSEFCDLFQSSRFVFQKYGYLFNLHGSSSLLNRGGSVLNLSFIHTRLALPQNAAGISAPPVSTLAEIPK